MFSIWWDCRDISTKKICKKVKPSTVKYGLSSIYTCAVYRAVHPELVTNLSTKCFIHSLIRLIAKRGRISTIYRDNGTNCQSTNNLLKSLN
ncbi:hypothetical protein X975_02759, partial [Stegodyphus mimosarum]